METKYGLIGYPLGHSFSARYFAEKFRQEEISGCSYTNFPLSDIGQLDGLLRREPTLAGFNVTIPYKEQIIPKLDALDDEARAIGAVNCVKISAGRLIGYNTDTYGFERSLRQLIGEARPAALVLGSGGASKAVRFVLQKLGISYMEVSRTKRPHNLTYEELNSECMAAHRLIVNATPLGTFPNVDGYPAIPYEMLTPEHFLFDLVYNPPLTRFLAQGQTQGASIMNGYDMLVGQAERSWEIWTGTHDANQA